MTLQIDVAADSAPDSTAPPLDAADARSDWTLKTYLVAALIVAATLAAILGLLVWVPNAFASAPGGCGGG